MLSEMTYQERAIESIKEKAIAVDVTVGEGFCRLRNALAVLASLDGHWIKGRGTSGDQKRLLPSLSTIKDIDGVSVSVLIDLHGCGDGKVARGRGDSYHLMRELGHALVDGRASFECAGGESVLVLRRYASRSSYGQFDSGAKAYVDAHSPGSGSTWIVTLDTCFTAVCLQAFLVTVCDSYLGSR